MALEENLCSSSWSHQVDLKRIFFHKESLLIHLKVILVIQLLVNLLQQDTTNVKLLLRPGKTSKIDTMIWILYKSRVRIGYISNVGSKFFIKSVFRSWFLNKIQDFSKGLRNKTLYIFQKKWYWLFLDCKQRTECGFLSVP